MKKMKFLFLLVSLLLGLTSFAQDGIVKETITYRDTLQMELFIDQSVKTASMRPLFVYTHGGGWNSNDWHINPETGVWKQMLQEGMVVVSLHYRQGMMMARAEGKLKNTPVVSSDSKEAFDVTEVASVIKHSIRMEVEDMYDAISYLYDHADRWNIDMGCVILGGGSAGAIGSLTAEYWLKNNDTLAEKHLPQGFSFAAIVSAAGAIWVDGGTVPTWSQKPCPMLFFHGSADRTVYPGNLHLETINCSLSGAETIIPGLRDQKVSYCYYVGDGYDHVMAGIPFETYGTDIMSFIHRVVYNKEQVAIKAIEEDYNGPRNLVDYFTKLMGLSKEEFLQKVKELNK